MPWDARLRKQISAPDVYRISMAADVVATRCGELAQQVGQPYGKGTFSEESISTYFSENAHHKLVIQKWQWTRGSTRLDVLCVGNQGSLQEPSGNAPTLLLNVTFAPSAATPVLRPSFLLRCTRRSTMVSGEPDERPHSDLTIWVDQSASRIKNAQLSQLSDDGSVLIDEPSIGDDWRRSLLAAVRPMY
jgi:hypothetical protein